MVRQVFAHRVFRPAVGEPPEEAEIAAGIGASFTVLGALNTIAQEGRVLNGHKVTLADCHLAPMMAYFVQAPEGAEAVQAHDALAAWWSAVAQRASLTDTDPGLPGT
jgi:glutathione S-transferase